jgi:hypothetical protein
MPFGSGNAFQIFVKLKPGVSYPQIAPKIKNIEKGTDNPRCENYGNHHAAPCALAPVYKLYEWKGGRRFRRIRPALWHYRSLCWRSPASNFINLTTARSEKSAGSRYPKAIGSDRKDLIINS